MWGHHHHHGGGGWGGGHRGWGGSHGGFGHHHHYGGGGGGLGLWPFLGGMAVGSIASNTGSRYSNPPQTVIYQQPYQPSASEMQARADAEAARRSAEQAALAAAQAQQAAAAQAQQAAAIQSAQSNGTRPDLILVKVKVPVGVSSGQLFSFRVNDRPYQIKCPVGASGGEEILVYVPSQSQDVPVQGVADATVAVDLGRHMLQSALGSSEDALQITATLAKDHEVDERALENVEHGIVAGRRGDIVRILGGTIEAGMAPPYDEYCLVRFGNGKVGKVSRFILIPYGAGLPPRAQT